MRSSVTMPLSGEASPSSSIVLMGAPATEVEEDFAECIAAWADSARKTSSNSYAPGFSLRRQHGSGSTTHNLEFQPINSAGSSHIEVRTRQQALGPVLTLNVGGWTFQSTASTLRQAPYFQEIFEADPNVAPLPSVDGANIFVDRPGELFKYILEFLRSGSWLLLEKSADLDFLNALRDEVCFYGLDGFRDCAPTTRVSEFATVWQFQADTSLYVDCFEQTIREDPDHQGLFRLCKYTGLLPLDQQTGTKRFKATSHHLQSVMMYFALRGFTLQHVVEGSMVTHTTSADGQHRSGVGTQYIMHRLVPACPSAWTPPNTQR